MRCHCVLLITGDVFGGPLSDPVNAVLLDKGGLDGVLPCQLYHIVVHHTHYAVKRVSWEKYSEQV